MLGAIVCRWKYLARWRWWLSRIAAALTREFAKTRKTAEKHASGDWMTMPSGAGHDAQTIAQVMPSAMLFVPSIEGKSHVFDENTSDDDPSPWLPSVY